MYGVNDNVWEQIIKIVKGYEKIDEVVLYGSRAKGNYKNGSDIDLSLKGSNINLVLQNSLLLDLDELYLPYSFDISIFEKIENEDLLEHINRVGIVVYKRNKS